MEQREADGLNRIFEQNNKKRGGSNAGASSKAGVTVDDFFAYMPTHSYIFAPSREMWPGSSVNARLPPICVGADDDGNPKLIPAALWLAKNKPVEQMTWAPGESLLIRNRLITGGGWVAHPGATVFNLYRPPTLALGDPGKSDAWLDHLRLVYPTDAAHIIRWLAHRVQRPQDKINHALVLGGPQGIGKDTLLEPAKRAIGSWNFAEVSPQQLLGRFNGFLTSVILRVSEARDLGEVNRYQFYDHLKAIIAAPPDVLRVDEKHLREYSIPNVCGVIITTNHLTDGIFLPADDRRHFVAWSNLTKDSFEPDYWAKLWSWYDRGGDRHVAAYLAALDLTGWDPKAPPPKTPAFWDIVDASRAPEDAELADVIDALSAGVKTAKGDLIPPLLSRWLASWTRPSRWPRRTRTTSRSAAASPPGSLTAGTGARHLTGSSSADTRRSATTSPRTASGRSAMSGRSSTRSPTARCTTAWPRRSWWSSAPARPCSTFPLGGQISEISEKTLSFFRFPPASKASRTRG